VTVDVKTVGDSEKGEAGDQKVTIRERDSMEQIRVPMVDLESVFGKLLGETTWREVAAAYPRAEG
jgi:glycyl-tRNA synthetase (class II)